MQHPYGLCTNFGPVAVEARFFEYLTNGIEMDRFNETKFNSFIGKQSVTPLSVTFWWCGAGEGCDFGSSFTIKFGSATGALFFKDHVHAKGLVSATDVEAGAATDFNTGHDFSIGVVFMGEEQDASAFDGADTGCAFSGEVFELAVLFFGQSNLVRFFWHVIAYSLTRRCTKYVANARNDHMTGEKSQSQSIPARPCAAVHEAMLAHLQKSQEARTKARIALDSRYCDTETSALQARSEASL